MKGFASSLSTFLTGKSLINLPEIRAEDGGLAPDDRYRNRREAHANEILLRALVLCDVPDFELDFLL